ADSAAFTAAHGVEQKIFLISDMSFGADGIVARPSIRSAAGLQGKKVAYTRGSPSHFLLGQYLKKYGMGMRDIKPVEVDDPGKAGEAFLSGSVDAAVTWDPFIPQIVRSGKGRLLGSSRTLPGVIMSVLVGNPKAMRERPEDFQKFVNGWLKGV